MIRTSCFNSLKIYSSGLRVNIYTEAPAAVDFTAEERNGKIILKWTEPENNGAPITKYSVYQRIVNDALWKKLEGITDTSKLEYVFSAEESKEYEFVVTARNKYGESSKTHNKRKVKVLEGRSNVTQGDTY